MPRFKCCSLKFLQQIFSGKKNTFRVKKLWKENFQIISSSHPKYVFKKIIYPMKFLKNVCLRNEKM